MGDLSKNFSTSEFACSCCKKSFVEASLVRGLQALSDLTLQLSGGKRHLVRILSGYRCVTHNKNEGGSKGSLHCAGKAADIMVDGLTDQQVYELVIQIPEFISGGVGIYPGRNFIHVDTRPEGRARWAQVKGKYVSLEEGVKEWHRLSKIKSQKKSKK